MARRIPPLNPLFTFEAAARHGSFTTSAQELNVTQGAVSRQVRTLEKYLGMELFERHHRSVRLTRIGKAFHDDLKVGFEQIEAAAARLTASRTRKSIIVRAYSSFATLWLIPRLAAFHEANPRILVELTASVQTVDFARDDVDIAVHFGVEEKRRDLLQDQLFPVAITPICSPALLKNKRSLRRPSDLENVTLLHTLIRPEDWPRWLSANGIVGDWVTRGYRFESSIMAYEAARNAVGVAIGVTGLVQSDLQEGRLVAPFPMTVSTPYSYWLLYPQAKTANPAVTVFRNWILEEAKRFKRDQLTGGRVARRISRAGT